MAHVPITSEIARATRTAALDGELESIFAANHSYWNSKGVPSSAANAEFDLTQLRLREILRELNELWHSS